MSGVRDIVLVHGLWVPGFVMAPLAVRLAQDGLRCHRFAYAGRAGSCAANAERLYRFARSFRPAHFVGHSLGGLVILDALNAHPEMAVGKVVLLGTPARGCAAGRRFARHRVGRWMLGASESLWRADVQACWSRSEPLGVVAGTLPIGLGRAFGRLPGPNDGVVCVEETEIEGMTGRISMPVGHSQMLVSARVAKQIATFLQQGRFGE
ncbi:MAG TPA: alpha/beta fold hydrolase [Burkholderiales bacterium]|nr:alpha/beta fold hydrolase [Burkholderiales bacterium]